MPNRLSDNNSKTLTNNQIKQFQYETETWQRLFEYMQTENIYLKYRLAQIVKENMVSKNMEEIESFQSQFITQDKLIGIFRNDVSKHTMNVKKTLQSDLSDKKELFRKQKKLRKEIEIAETKFNKLKFEFNTFFCELFLSE